MLVLILLSSNGRTGNLDQDLAQLVMSAFTSYHFCKHMDPDQAALVRAAWSGSTLFAGNMILHNWTWWVISLFYVQTWKFI